jgi:hypothetical protein
MITPIDTQLINDLTELSRSQLMKSTIIMDSAKREQITLTIMDAGNNANKRVYSIMLNGIRSEFALARRYNNFKSEK